MRQKAACDTQPILGTIDAPKFPFRIAAHTAMFLDRVGTGASGKRVPTRTSGRVALGSVRWAMVFVLVAVVAALLAPQTADAHSGDASVQPSAHGQGGAEPNAEPPDFDTSRLSPPCPAGPGTHCDCDSAAVLIRAGQTPILDAGASSSHLWLPAGPAKLPANQVTPPPRLLFSPASPRAPPLFL